MPKHPGAQLKQRLWFGAMHTTGDLLAATQPRKLIFVTRRQAMLPRRPDWWDVVNQLSEELKHAQTSR